MIDCSSSTELSFYFKSIFGPTAALEELGFMTKVTCSDGTQCEVRVDDTTSGAEMAGECCVRFKGGCCTHSENEYLDLM